MGQWVMGHSFDGSHGSWVTARDPFAAQIWSRICVPVMSQDFAQISTVQINDVNWNIFIPATYTFY